MAMLEGTLPGRSVRPNEGIKCSKKKSQCSHPAQLVPGFVLARTLLALRIGLGLGKVRFEPRMNFAPSPVSRLGETFSSNSR